MTTAKIGPQNKDEELTFATEELLASVQYSIQKLMKVRGVSRADLAERMGATSAWVTQLLSDEANLTVQTIAKVYYALDDSCEFVSHYLTELENRPDSQIAQMTWVVEKSESDVRLHTRNTIDVFMQIVQASCDDTCLHQNDDLKDQKQKESQVSIAA